MQEYFSRNELSNSDLGLIKKSIEHYLRKFDAREDSEALKFGSAFHSFILENDKFFQNYVVAPKFDKRTKQGKEDFALFESENAGKNLIDESDFERLNQMRLAILKHPIAKQLVESHGSIEHEIYFEQHGEPCRMKADKIIPEKKIIIDLKSTQDCKLESCIKSILNFEYYRQAAFYLAGAKAEYFQDFRFMFVFVEKTAPYLVQVVELTPEFLEYGQNEIKSLILKFQGYKENKKSYTGYSDVIETIDLPKWLNRDLI